MYFFLICQNDSYSVPIFSVEQERENAVRNRFAFPRFIDWIVDNSVLSILIRPVSALSHYLVLMRKKCVSMWFWGFLLVLWHRFLLSCFSFLSEWYWKCWICPWTLRLLAVLMFAFSLMVIWSECLFFVKSPVLSLFAIFIDLARTHYNYVAVEVSFG